MKPILPILLVFLLAACAAPAPAATPTADLATPLALPTESPASPTEAALPFEPATFRDEANGFELDYPAAWTQIGGEAQSRGYYQQIVSWQPASGGITEIPEGGSLLQIAVYDWEPVNDLSARLEMRRANFLNSGNTILEEEQIELASGVAVLRLLMDTADGPSLVYFATVNDLYLELSGSGDIATLDAAMRTLRIDGVNP